MMASQEKKTNILQKIKALSLFESCDENFFRALEDQAQIISLEKNQILFLHEEEASRFFIITNGWIKLFRETFDGTQAVVDILSPYHMFGETALFEENLYPYSAEAVENAEVISLPLSLLKSEIEKNPKITMAMLSSMTQMKRRQDQELEHRTIQNASQRIGCFLLRLTNNKENGHISIHLPYDKTLVAARLGMQPETFSRALAKLKAETGIEIKGATITLKSLDQLSQYSCMTCSSEYPCKDLRTMATN